MGCCTCEFYCILKAHLESPKQIVGGFAGLVLFPVVVINHANNGNCTEKGLLWFTALH